jgi:hypothetical protein
MPEIAPFTLVQDGQGYKLQPTSRPPSKPEADLAAELNARFDQARNSPNAMAQYIPALVEICKLGLTEQNRQPDIARQRYEALGLRPINSANTGQTSGRGAFILFVDNTNRIHADRTPDGPEPTDEQLVFANDLDRQERFVRTLLSSVITDQAAQHESLHQAATRLMSAAQFGLQNAKPNVRLGRLAIDGVIMDALSEHGVKIRSRYLYRLGQTYLGGIFFFLVLAVASRFIAHWFFLKIPVLVLPDPLLGLVCVAMLWLSIGAWLSSAFSVEAATTDAVSSILSETLTDKIRVFYVLCFGFGALVLLHTKAVVFALGGDSHTAAFTTEAVFSRLATAMITGLLLGLGARSLPNSLISNSAKLVAALGK